MTDEEHDRTVLLNSQYPASGCYELGSTTPLWTAPWDDRDYWIVSDDNRFLVRLNIHGDGQYSSRSVGEGALSWGLKFYDRGKELKSYDVSELLDYPSLMPFTSADWHYQWFGDGPDIAIQDGQFIFQTSTHEYYRFDLATGAIIQQFRMWRTLARAATVLFIIAVVGVTVLVVRKRKRATAAQQTAYCLKELSRYYAPRFSTRFFRYSLRTLLLVTTAIAIMCLVIHRWPHVALLAAAVLIAIALTRSASRYGPATPLSRSSGWRRVGFVILVASAGLAWCCCYVLSVAPVLGLMHWLDAPDDVRMAVALTVYRPLIWHSSLYSYSLHQIPPLEWYFRAWGSI